MTNDGSKLQQHLPGSNVENSEPALSGGQFAADLRGFGIIGILSILLILLGGNLFIGGIVFIPLGGLFALVWTLRSKTAWSELGYVLPKSWISTMVVGLVFGFGLKLFMKTIVMPLLGANAINPRYHFLSANKATFPVALLFMVVAGFSEETVFRGFLFERFGKLFRPSFWSKTLIVLISAGLFGLGHLADQGLVGFEQAIITGLVYGIIYAKTGKIWMLIIAHAVFDITAVAIIYWNLESEVAHFFFK
jgi:membrane protease YdiL (CAAX protease family)